ncbi:hypothetical protein FaHV1S18_036 [Falconid herpesvirus 1]|uniref:Uncharacterized protein n=2 Tax=Columbid alphaherpesvirus 1 TaxID=93386 RepID=A0A068EP68_9ALPH|nr:hypothetical protein FaHV1S18_036 [Falconid herpesvirus 1]YP_009352930.1 hypothetical protein CoHVHLJ_036 [Columbid alphaherpesvirus 1]AID52726.1 hypothetical protein FaHV1S18_036 [Falconid herpesvirus 1]ARD71347.1 hypothetical protein CoHVHLJ_036 [Columbid alphaherpesvirus 1]
MDVTRSKPRVWETHHGVYQINFYTSSLRRICLCVYIKGGVYKNASVALSEGTLENPAASEAEEEEDGGMRRVGVSIRLVVMPRVSPHFTERDIARKRGRS